MLIVLLVLSFILIAFGIWCICWDMDDVGPGIIILAMFLFVGTVIGFFCNADSVVEGRVIDQKIEMYQEENQAIENDIDILVSNFMEHEQKVMWAAEGGSPVTLVNLYPDLKSDALVQEQIRIYTENNAKIKELKEDKIDVSKAKWWLYFGK